jgi:TonB family protein
VSWFRRVTNVFRRASLEREFEDEISFHLEERIRRNLGTGMTASDAEADARARFGNAQRVKAGMRAARTERTTVPVLVGLTLVAIASVARIYWGAGQRVYELGGDVMPPVRLSAPKAQYSPAAMRAKIQGTVRVECVIRPNGACSDVAVIRSLDSAFGLDDEAVRTVRGSRFQPARLKGHVVATHVMFDVKFALQ